MALEGPRKMGSLALLFKIKTPGETSRHPERQQAPENSPASTWRISFSEKWNKPGKFYKNWCVFNLIDGKLVLRDSPGGDSGDGNAAGSGEFPHCCPWPSVGAQGGIFPAAAVGLKGTAPGNVLGKQLGAAKGLKCSSSGHQSCQLHLPPALPAPLPPSPALICQLGAP